MRSTDILDHECATRMSLPLATSITVSEFLNKLSCHRLPYRRRRSRPRGVSLRVLPHRPSRATFLASARVASQSSRLTAYGAQAWSCKLAFPGELWTRTARGTATAQGGRCWAGLQCRGAFLNGPVKPRSSGCKASVSCVHDGEVVVLAEVRTGGRREGRLGTPVDGSAVQEDDEVVLSSQLEFVAYLPRQRRRLLRVRPVVLRSPHDPHCLPNGG